jgi:hypothetical protein
VDVVVVVVRVLRVLVLVLMLAKVLLLGLARVVGTMMMYLRVMKTR